MAISLCTDLKVDRTNRISNITTKDAIIKGLGDFCEDKTIDELDNDDKQNILKTIRKLDDNYCSIWFGKKTHTESTIITWVLIYLKFKGVMPPNLSELNNFIQENFKDAGLLNSDKVDNGFDWGRNSNQRYFDNICVYIKCYLPPHLSSLLITHKKHDYYGLIEKFKPKKFSSNFDYNDNINDIMLD